MYSRNLKTVLLGCIYKWQQNILYVLLGNDCSVRVYQSIICCNFLKIFPIMLALCLMLSVTYYAQSYAGIIGWSLVLPESVAVLFFYSLLKSIL